MISSLILLPIRNLCSPSSSPNAPLWLQLTLLLDITIDSILIYTFHPSILANSHRPWPSRFPSAMELLAQVAVFLIVEQLLEGCVLRFIQIPFTKASSGSSTRSKAVIELMQQQNPVKHQLRVVNDENNEVARRLVVDFMRPRGTLLLAIALLSMPASKLTRWTGSVHPTALIFWAALQQIVRV